MASEYAETITAEVITRYATVMRGEVAHSASLSRIVQTAIDAALRDQRQADLDAVRRAPLSTNDRAWALAAIEAAEMKVK